MGVSVTIDNLDGDTLDRLHVEAQRRGLDVGALIKQMIQDGLLPASPPNAVELRHDLDDLAGTWSEEDAQEFLTATAQFNTVDEDLWR